MDSRDFRNGYGPLVLRLIIAVMFLSVMAMYITGPKSAKATVSVQIDTTTKTQVVGPMKFRTKDTVRLAVVASVSTRGGHDHSNDIEWTTHITVMQIAARYLYTDIRDGNQKFEKEVRTRLSDRLWRVGGVVDSIRVYPTKPVTR